jgi:hypothetical protein
LPSSPHWAPITATLAMIFLLGFAGETSAFAGQKESAWEAAADSRHIAQKSRPVFRMPARVPA